MNYEGHIRVPRVSAALLTDQIAILREQIGADVVARAMDSLPEAQRAELRALTSVGWIDVAIAKAIFVAAAHEAGRDVESVHRNAVRAGVEQTFKSLWRLILRLTTDNALVTRTPMIYSKTYDSGKLSSRIVAPGRAEIVLEGWPGADELSLRGLAVGIETTLIVAGRKGVRVNFDRRSDGALFVASWRA